MFDSVGAFTKQFTPIEGGYLYYPSKKSGGKLVNPDEYAQLVGDWRKVAGTKGILKTAGIVMLALLAWAVVSSLISLPPWSGTLYTTLCVIGVSGWLLWANFAARRLVRGRPDVAPIRPPAEVARNIRATMNWRFVIFGIVFCSLIFARHVSAYDRDVSEYTWMIFSGVGVIGYVWIAARKLLDRIN